MTSSQLSKPRAVPQTHAINGTPPVAGRAMNTKLVRLLEAAQGLEGLLACRLGNSR